MYSVMEAFLRRVNLVRMLQVEEEEGKKGINQSVSKLKFAQREL